MAEGKGAVGTAPASTPDAKGPSSIDAELQHSEFGHCSNDAYRWRSEYDEGDLEVSEEDSPSYITVLSTYMSYIIIILLGHIRDYLGKRFYKNAFVNLVERDGFAPLNSDFDSFYTPVTGRSKQLSIRVLRRRV